MENPGLQMELHCVPHFAKLTWFYGFLLLIFFNSLDFFKSQLIMIQGKFHHLLKRLPLHVQCMFCVVMCL